MASTLSARRPESGISDRVDRFYTPGMPSIAQIAAQVRPFITEVQAEEVDRDRRSDAPPRIVDVREQHEWDAGHIPGAELIPLGTVASAAPERLPKKDERIVLHCAAGVRSAVAA